MDNKTYQSIEQCYRISSYFRFACLNHGFLCLPFLSVPFPLLFFPSEGGCRRNRDWLKLTLEKGDFVVIIQFTWCPIGIAMYLIKTGTERASWIDAFLRLLYFSLKVSRHLLHSLFSCEQHNEHLLCIISTSLFAVPCSLSWLSQFLLCHKYFSNCLLDSLFTAD